MTDGLEGAREDKWAAARRVVSDDHPANCPCVRDHLEVSFIHGMEYATERASESALRAAAQEVLEADGAAESGDPWADRRWDYAMSALKAALDGAPWEPSEEQVERLGYWLATRDGEALSYEWGRDGTGPDGGVYRDYTTEARAALKAGMGIESGSAG